MNEYDRTVIGVVPLDELVTFRRVCRDDRGTWRDLLRDVAVRIERLQEDFPGPIVSWFYVWSFCRRHESIISFAEDRICWTAALKPSWTLAYCRTSGGCRLAPARVYRCM
jgi:hypothetical protein